MFDLDHWQEIAHALSRNKIRTLLTAFGVFWGIFLLLVMLGSGNGLRNGVTAGFSESATNSFFVWTRATGKPFKGFPRGRRFEMVNADVAAIAANVPEAEVVAPRLQLGGYASGGAVRRQGKSGAFSVMGDVPAIARIMSFRITSGRFLHALDLAERRKVAVIGRRVGELLFEAEEDPIGASIEIRGAYFTVVGVFASGGRPEEADEQDQSLFVPFTTFQESFNAGDRIGWLSITSRQDVPASVAEEKVLALLKSRHQVAPDDDRAFGHFNVEEEYLKLQGLFAGIRALVWIVGTGTLAAGAIGVSNIMLVIVRERTKELGIRRAVGATPWHVTSQIVLEAALLTSAAGMVGVVAGVAVLEAVGRLLPDGGDAMFRRPEVSLAHALQALAILVVAGVLAGFLPARRAVAVDPVEALRMEN